jgi:lipopolysaccharide export system permease protein
MPPATLFRYIAARLTASVAALAAGLTALVALVDFVENLRFAGKVDAGLLFAVQLTLARAPGMAQSMAPFIFLLAALWTFGQLNRRSELSVMRSAGLSAWRVIAPAALVASLAGLLLIVAVDPVASRLMGQGEKMKNDVRGKSSSLVRVFGDGLWLRQRDIDETLIINAKGFDAARGALVTVTIWRLAPDHAFKERIDAPEAVLSGRTIEMREARLKESGVRPAQRTPYYSIPTRLTLDDLRTGVPPPDTMSVFDLPRFILLAEAAGLSTVRYNLRFHDLCSTPLKLVGMVLIAAIFSVGPMRGNGAARLVAAAIGVGFALYILSEFSSALGESGAAPAALAAWAPALVGFLLAVTALLRFEES